VLNNAEKCIRRARPQIDTAYRWRISAELGRTVRDAVDRCQGQSANIVCVSFCKGHVADIVSVVDREMSRELRESAFTTQEKLALSYRILDDEGNARTLAGQLRCARMRPV
jgi:hypothetical protein